MTSPGIEPDGAHELWRRVRELEAIARIASNFTFEQSLEAMMEDVAREVVQASDSALTCIVGLGDRTTNLATHVLGSYGAPENFNAKLELAWRTAGTPVVSGPMQSRRPQVMEISELLKRTGYEEVREAQQQAGWVRIAAVPMIYRSEAVGLMIVAYPESATPAAPEIAFLEAVSNQVAVAVENARLFERARAAAVVEERQRLSRELHDSVSQALYGISLGAQTAREVLSLDPGKVAEPIDYIVSLAELGLAEMRALIFELRPEALATEGLLPALHRQIAALQARHKFAVDLDLAFEPDIPSSTKEMLYRVAQQALNNIAKHAAATKVAVSLTRDGPHLDLTIRDDGRGFAVAENYPGHLGVTSMRERVSREGGALSIESAPGAGCVVAVRLGG